MQSQDYPALFRCADAASNSFQWWFLRLVQAEYATLILAAILTLSPFNSVLFYLAYAFVFIVGLVFLLVRSFWKPEQNWYRCRALAESVKTLSWRYVMHAKPFQSSEFGENVPRAEFRNQLHSVFETNKATAERIKSDWSANDQITDHMLAIRGLGLHERKQLYLKDRIDDQAVWYAKKARSNSKNALNWTVVAFFAYAAAIALALCRIAYPSWQFWPIEPIIVIAASIVGWTQIKKFNELSAAYTVAAHEIGLIKPKADEGMSDEGFSEFVNDAEMAFSREHTLWIARQSN